MTISSHQVDSVIKAYTKQYKSRLRMDTAEEGSKERYADVVTLTAGETSKSDIYNKISYSLIDIIRKDGSENPA